MTARKRATCQLQDAKGRGGLTAHVKVSNVSPSYAVSLSYATIFAAILTSKSLSPDELCSVWGMDSPHPRQQRLRFPNG